MATEAAVHRLRARRAAAAQEDMDVSSSSGGYGSSQQAEHHHLNALRLLRQRLGEDTTDNSSSDGSVALYGSGNLGTMMSSYFDESQACPTGTTGGIHTAGGAAAAASSGMTGAGGVVAGSRAAVGAMPAGARRTLGEIAVGAGAGGDSTENLAAFGGGDTTESGTRKLGRNLNSFRNKSFRRTNSIQHASSGGGTATGGQNALPGGYGIGSSHGAMAAAGPAGDEFYDGGAPFPYTAGMHGQQQQQGGSLHNRHGSQQHLHGSQQQLHGAAAGYGAGEAGYAGMMRSDLYDPDYLQQYIQQLYQQQNQLQANQMVTSSSSQEVPASAYGGAAWFPRSKSVTGNKASEDMAGADGLCEYGGFNDKDNIMSNGAPAPPLLAEEALADIDNSVIQDIFNRVETAQRQLDNYKQLFFFLLFVLLYLAILFLQSESLTGYEITSTHQVLLPPGMTVSDSFSFENKDDFYTWINTSIIQPVWQDPTCGDGVCERPLEFASFGDGRFGCSKDCGEFQSLTAVTISMSTDFQTMETMQASSWNLCMTSPANLCWFDSPQAFTSLISNVVLHVALPDGDWQLLLSAPGGGVKGSVQREARGTQRTPNVGTSAATTLIAWGNCVSDDVPTPRSLCRKTCEMLTFCLREKCNPRMKMRTFSGAFVDCFEQCNDNPQAFMLYHGEECNSTTISSEVISLFPNVACEGNQSTWPQQEQIKSEKQASSLQASSRLHSAAAVGEVAPSSEAAVVTPSTSAAANATSIIFPFRQLSPNVSKNTTIWQQLGSSDDHRFFRLQVAVGRLLLTAVKHECLAAVAPALSARADVTAGLCVLFGGPTADARCHLVDHEEGGQVVTRAGLFWRAWRTHRSNGMQISREHMEAFAELAVLALQSVTQIDEPTEAALFRVLFALSEAIVDESAPGCPHGVVLAWRGGISHETSVHVGDQITWVWSDEEPHSIKLAGMGEEYPFFQGFGGGRLLVAKDEVCSPNNIGPHDDVDDPSPCVLRNPTLPSDVFKYTRVFTEPATIHYEGRRFQESATGVVRVLPLSQDPEVADAKAAVSRDEECAPACRLSLLMNGRCDAACNTASCSFDGGDCSCHSRLFRSGVCDCPAEQKMGDDGTCCTSDAVGSDLSFPFSLRMYGESASETNREFAEEAEGAVARYVSGRNRLIMGMLITQSRWQGSECREARFQDLSGACIGGSTRAPFGHNPYFSARSQLFSPTIINSADFQNATSADANATSTTFNATSADMLRGPDGLPYGFLPPPEEISEDFPLLFDINLDQQGADRRLQYLVDGDFIDNSTKSLKVMLVTYNGDERLFVISQISIRVLPSGKLPVTQEIRRVSLELYTNVPQNWFRVALEIIYLLCLFWNTWEELHEIVTTWRLSGFFFAYFGSFWNWVDLTSLIIQFICVGLWIHFAIIDSTSVTINVRYDVYRRLRATPFPWALNQPPTGLNEAMAVFDQMMHSLQLRSTYFALQGINIFLKILRILKLLDFQPYMGVFTRTLTAAAKSLFHFFLLWVIVFSGFAAFGCVALGAIMEQFRSVQSSFLTCFLIILGDTTTFQEFLQLQGWDYVAAMIFWFTFVTIVIFILLNFLIAIIVDAFMDVKDVAHESTSLTWDIWNISNHFVRRAATPYMKYEKMKAHLKVLGGTHMLTPEERRFVERYKKVREGMNGIMSASCMCSAPKEAEEDAEERVVKVNNMTLDEPSLHAILGRTFTRELDFNDAKSCNMRPSSLAKALLSQFGEMAKVEKKDVLAHPLPPRKRSKQEIVILTELVQKFEVETQAALQEIRNCLMPEEDNGEESDNLEEEIEEEKAKGSGKLIEDAYIQRCKGESSRRRSGEVNFSDESPSRASFEKKGTLRSQLSREGSF